LLVGGGTFTAVSDLTTPQFEKTQFLRCNTYGHAWFEYDNSDWRPTFGFALVLRCERCGSERRDALGNSGQVVGRHYDHPDGYKYERGTRPSRTEFRTMLMEIKVREQRKTRQQRKGA